MKSPPPQQVLDTIEMAVSRKPDQLAIAIVAICCLSWGFQQVAAKHALSEVSGLTQAAIRSVGAACVVAIYMALREPRELRIEGEWVQGIFAGLLFTLEFMLLFVGLEHTSASRAVLFLYTHPFLVALGLLVLAPSERLRPLQWAGLATSFIGVGLALRVAGADSSPTLIGDLAMLGAAACWGAQTLQFRLTRLRDTPPTRALLYQLVVSAILLSVGAWLRGEVLPQHLSGLVIASLAYQTVWIAGVTFCMWIWLIGRYRAGELSAFTFATPLIGVAAAAIMLGEPIPAGFVVAVGMVAAGIAMVNWPQRASN